AGESRGVRSVGAQLSRRRTGGTRNHSERKSRVSHHCAASWLRRRSHPQFVLDSARPAVSLRSHGSRPVGPYVSRARTFESKARVAFSIDATRPTKSSASAGRLALYQKRTAKNIRHTRQPD